MLHFPDLEPTRSQMKDPKMLAKLKRKVLRRIQDLTKADFEVKIIDYGLALPVKLGELAQTPCGTVNLIAPDQLKPGYDHRVDVWGLGLIAYMLHTTKLMFETSEEFQ